MILSCTVDAAPLSPSPVIAPPQLDLVPVITSGLTHPVFLTHAGDGREQLFIVEQEGRIRLFSRGTLHPIPFLDISARVLSGGERGLLGLAFHPQFATTGRLFVNYTREPDGATVIAEFHAAPSAPSADPEGKALLVIPQPYANHNGGMIAFGPDGFLYVGTGDGGAAGDPGNRAQNLQSLLGKILRLDVDSRSPYGVPSTNPFLEPPARPEIFAFGFRNPWRFSFDRQSGRLWAADVGQDDWEEVDIVEAGKNYGWRLMEGSHCFVPPTGCERLTHLVRPVTEYAHTRGRCTIIGGYVYRGRQMPSLIGTYLFADFCTGEIFGFRDERHTVLRDTDLRISSFGEDETGEIYVLGYAGTVYRIAEPRLSNP
ncbi:MAG: glucose dehydrogenase [Nitrospirae bacterium]|nr:MAG: glucose dehydrogenase [Nitrospirota bacterium]